MPRKIVQLVTGNIYHVYNRGVDKRKVFLDKSDFLRFYQSLLYFNQTQETNHISTAKILYSINNSDPLVGIHAYALLPNHYHLLIEQFQDGGISEYLKRVSGGYTSYFNKKQKRTGTLFQGRFKRVQVLSNEYYNYLFAYINENYSVHNIIQPPDVYSASNGHYQKLHKSNLINAQSLTDSYDPKEAKLLAQDIHLRRQEFKSFILE